MKIFDPQVICDASVVANILTNAGTQVAIFAIAFYRTQFAVSREWIAGIYEVAVIIYIVEPLISDRIINRFGAKRLAVASTLLAAFFTMTFFFVPKLWLAFAFDMPHVWFAAASAPAFVYLVLERVPESRGTMISLNSLFNTMGNFIAPAAGGVLLIVSGTYGAVGVALGSMTVAGAAILIFLVKDPTRASADPQ